MGASRKPRIIRVRLSTKSTITTSNATSLLPSNPLQPSPLAVFELLETILLLLPMQDLLLAQSVCRFWASVICKSTHIQRALYLLPETIPHTINNSTGLGNSFIPNPLLAKAFKNWMLFDIGLPGVPSPVGIVLKPPQHGLQWESSCRRKAASWKKMLLTQPPIKRIIVEDLRIAPDYDDCFSEIGVNPAGVKMGDVLELEDDELLEG